VGLLAEAFNPSPRAEAWNESAGPLSDFWYRDPHTGFALERGIGVSADTILNCSTVLAAVRFRGDSWAMCPPSTFRKTSKGREEDSGHYSQLVLRNPNTWQTGFDWRHLNGVWMAIWGDAYNEIVGGPSSFAEELRPLHPKWTEPVDQRNDGSLIYRTRPPLEEERVLGQERVLHFPDLSTDGIKGVPMYQLIRNVVGIALLAEKHAATFLKKGARISGLLVPSNPMEDAELDELRDSVNASMGGASNTGTFGVLPYGVDLKPISNTARESQMAELDDRTTAAILRFLGVPGVVVGFADKTATYASAEAFFEKGGIKHCVLPILTRVEAREEKALLLRGDGRQIKHNLDVLERANLQIRTEALVRSVGGPFRTVNEARTIEDMNRLEDERYDEVLTPGNMSADPEAAPPAAPPAAFPNRKPAAPPDDDDDDEDAEDDAAARKLAVRFATAAAERVVRRELKAIQAKAPKNARSSDAWRAAILELYGGEHVELVAEAMMISKDAALVYCTGQAAALMARGLEAAATWETDIPPQLVQLALEANA
jgi:HK97 family phage portal protein